MDGAPCHNIKEINKYIKKPLKINQLGNKIRDDIQLINASDAFEMP